MSRFYWREIQILLEIIFAAMNLKNIKDDYNGKFVEISEKVRLLPPIS
jgi:hypothetical protein